MVIGLIVGIVFIAGCSTSSTGIKTNEPGKEMDSAGPGRAGNPVCLGGGPGLWAQRLRGSLHPAAVSHPGGYPAGGGGLHPGAGLRRLCRRNPTPMLSDRLTRGVELYQAGWADKLLMSGDNRSQDYNELATMHRVALERAFPRRTWSWTTRGCPPMTASTGPGTSLG